MSEYEASVYEQFYDPVASEVEQLRAAFQTVDRQASGLIPAHGLEHVLRALGMQPVAEDIGALLGELGVEPDGEIRFVEFAGVLARLKV